jgi:hypothetical protein
MILAQSTPGDQEQVFLNILTKATSKLFYYYIFFFLEFYYSKWHIFYV